MDSITLQVHLDGQWRDAMVVNFDRLVHHLCSGTSGENLSYASWHERPERSIDASGGACAQITARHPSIAHDDMIAIKRLFRSSLVGSAARLGDN